MSQALRIDAPAADGAALAAALRVLDAALPRGRQDRAALDALADTDPVTYAIVLLAALACGRTAPVRAGLRRAAAASLPVPILPLLTARYLAWTGDVQPVLSAWPAARDAAFRLLELAPPDDGAGRILHAGTIAGLERTATDLGDPQLAARLHRAGRGAAAAADTTTETRILAAALDVPFVNRAAAAHPPQVAEAGDVRAAAFGVLHSAHLLLGAAPDAFRNRLWLRPRLPAGTDALSASNLPLGDGALYLHLIRTTQKLEVRLEQTAGAIPGTILLELLLETPPVACSVDGRPASLDARRTEAGFLVPVQLVLDHARSVEIVAPHA